MLLLCAIVIFELAAIAVLVFIAIRKVKKQGDSYGIDMAAIFTALNDLNGNINLKMDVIDGSIDRSIRHIDAIKDDLDIKFGPDLVKQLNAIFALKEHPGKLVLGQDGEFHKINRDY